MEMVNKERKKEESVKNEMMSVMKWLKKRKGIDDVQKADVSVSCFSVGGGVSARRDCGHANKTPKTRVLWKLHFLLGLSFSRHPFISSFPSQPKPTNKQRKKQRKKDKSIMFGGIPFESFMGGHGAGASARGFGGSGANEEAVDTTKLYETLEVDKDADANAIKKAYRKLSRTHHPDKGGDEHKFKEINAAYEILSDPDKRAAYDKYGLEGVDDGGAAAHGGEDLFSMFFGHARGKRGASSAGPRKGPSVNHPIKVSLEDLYNGKTVKLAINRKVIVGEVNECTKCHGQGAIMEIRQIGPGMITQVQRHCDACQGQGNTAERKQERKVLEVFIEKGMEHNQKITFRGMADEIPNMQPGDINFIIQEKEHELFKRKGADLLLTKDLTLKQALCGFTVCTVLPNVFTLLYCACTDCEMRLTTLTLFIFITPHYI